MKIVLTGATGFVGGALTEKLLAAGHQVSALVRNAERAARVLPAMVARLPAQPDDEASKQALREAGALIHLAGESVAGGRWTAARRRRMHESRGPALRKLIAAATEGGKGGPGVIISASAVGYYGDRGEEQLSEASPPGEGFLADVCRDWEDALATPGTAPGGGQVRTVSLRNGMVLGRQGGVLGRRGGAMAKLLPVFRLGLGGRLGGGGQWMSWIHLEDLTELIMFALSNAEVSGPVNAVAPQPVTNREFTRTLAEVLRRPAFFHAPAFALRLALGEMSCILLDSQRVLPDAALARGFAFRYADIRSALEDVCGASG